MNRDRNLDRVQLERVRKNIDPVFNQIHDELEEAYYKYWKKGLSKPFYGHDYVLGEDNKDKFDKLHGLLWAIYAVARHRENLSFSEDRRYEERKYNIAKIDEFGRVIKTKDQEGLEWIKNCPIKCPGMINKLQLLLRKPILTPEEQ